VSERWDGSSIHKRANFIVYGGPSDVDLMDKWYLITKKKDIIFITLSERELKLVSKIDLHNLIPFSKFMEGKNKPFKRVATYCLIDKMMDDYRSVFNHYKNINKVSSKLADVMDKLSSYRRDNRLHINDDTRAIIIEHATNINMFDESIDRRC
jgi:hypothetical protein